MHSSSAPSARVMACEPRSVRGWFMLSFLLSVRRDRNVRRLIPEYLERVGAGSQLFPTPWEIGRCANIEGVSTTTTSGNGAAFGDGASPILRVEDLSIGFGGREAVHGIGFEIAAGQTLGLVGESGSGKSVTALSVLRLLPAEASVVGGFGSALNPHLKIQMWGARGAVDLLALPEREMRRRRGSDVAMVFQEPMTALNPVMRVGAQIAETVRAHQPGLSSKAVDQLVLDAMREVALPEPERRVRDYPHQFSGGQTAAHSDCDGDREPASAADCRRADDGARCHRAGADSGATEGAAADAWPLHAVYLARPCGGGRGMRPAGRSRRGDAAGTDCRAGGDARAIRQAKARLHAAAAGVGADDGLRPHAATGSLKRSQVNGLRIVIGPIFCPSCMSSE